MKTNEYGTRMTSRTACAFNYSSAFTPTVLSVTPPSGAAGTELVITGSGFDPSDSNEVTISGKVCPVTTSTATELRCTVPALSAGSHVVSVRVPRTGYSSSCAGCTDPPIRFNSTLTITSIQPVTGSIGGGTDVTILGNGFSLSDDNSNVSVTVGGRKCAVTFANLTTVKCTTQNTTSEQLNVDVIVSVADELGTQSAHLGAAYSFADAQTPRLASVSPVRGSGGGGTTVTISGDLKASSTSSVNYVKVWFIKETRDLSY